VPKLSQATTDLIVASAIQLAIQEIPAIIAYFTARNETVTEAGILAQLEARGVSLIARNEAWLIMKGALSALGDEVPPFA